MGCQGHEQLQLYSESFPLWRDLAPRRAVMNKRLNIWTLRTVHATGRGCVQLGDT